MGKQMIGGFTVGLLVTGAAAGVAVMADFVFGSGWGWHRFALLFLVLGGFLLLSLFTTPGTELPQGPVEMRGRIEGGTATDFRPDRGGIAAIMAMLPPTVAFFALIFTYGFGDASGL